MFFSLWERRLQPQLTWLINCYSYPNRYMSQNKLRVHVYDLPFKGIKPLSWRAQPCQRPCISGFLAEFLWLKLNRKKADMRKQLLALKKQYRCPTTTHLQYTIWVSCIKRSTKIRMPSRLSQQYCKWWAMIAWYTS